MTISTVGSSAFGVVVAGCQLRPASGGPGRLSFDRGLHIAAIAEHAISIGPTVRVWRLTIDNDTPEAFESYLPILTGYGVSQANGDTPGSVIVVPRVHRISGPTPLVYEIALASPAIAGSEGPGWPSWGALRSTQPPDNGVAIAAGAPIAFPTVEGAEGGVTQAGTTGLQLPIAGTYKVTVIVTVQTSPGQLVLAMKQPAGVFVELPETQVGRELEDDVTSAVVTGAQIVMSCLVTTPVPDCIIEVWNPAASGGPLVVQDNAGGDGPTHSTFRAELLPLADPSPGLGLTFIDPTISNVGGEGFGFVLVQTGLDSAIAPAPPPLPKGQQKWLPKACQQA